MGGQRLQEKRATSSLITRGKCPIGRANPTVCSRLARTQRTESRALCVCTQSLHQDMATTCLDKPHLCAFVAQPTGIQRWGKMTRLKKVCAQTTCVIANLGTPAR